MPRMIVDVHTHVFPPRMIARRGRLVPLEPAFAELYGEASAKMVNAETLLESMDAAGVDVSVACGFWWREPDLAEEHAAYLLDAAAASGGRIVPFVPVALGADGVDANALARLDRVVASGATGLGEVRPATQASPAEAVDVLLGEAAARGLPALVHASEEVGHGYRGKTGGYTQGAFWRLIESQPGLRVIAAHWGGGFPFAALMPEVRAVIEAGRLVFDTAATPYLYEPAVFTRGIDLVGVEHVLWGSDFPLRSQLVDRRAVESALRSDEERAAVLGGNAARFLGLSEPGERTRG